MAAVGGRSGGAATTLAGFDSDGAKLNSVDDTPRFVFAGQESDGGEAGVGEGFEKGFLSQGTADATAPEFGVLLQIVGYFAIADDVRDDGAAAVAKDAEDFVEKAAFGGGFDEVEHAIRDDDIDGFGRDEGFVGAEGVGDGVSSEVVSDRGGCSDGRLREARCEFVDIKGEILNSTLAKLHVGVTETLGDDGRVAAGDFEHVIGHVDPDHASRTPHDLGGDEADLAGAATEVEDGLAWADVTRGIAAAVILVDDLLGDDLEQFGIVLNGAAEGGFGSFGGGGVALLDRRFGAMSIHRKDLSK